MKQRVWIPLVLCIALCKWFAVAQEPSPGTNTSEVVWISSSQCSGGHKLGVTVRLDHKVLYRGLLPICQGGRDTEDGKARFHFVGGHTFQGQYRTRSTESIEGDIWQASGDPDALILGISFDEGKHKQILLNTLHVARPEKQSSSELDRGLFITTYPLPVR
jgi:hypothetical protein